MKNNPLNFTDRDGLRAKKFLGDTLRLLADVLILAIAIDTANAPGVDNYDEVMARGKIHQDKVDSPSGLALGLSFFIPGPGGKKQAGQSALKGAIKIVDGSVMKVDEALTAAEEFLGKGYKELSNGRFVSEFEDGFRQVRMGLGDILGKHGGGPHINLETLDKNGKLIPESKVHIFLNQ